MGCNNGWGGGSCIWIVLIIIVLFCCGGCGNSWGNGCGNWSSNNNGCGC